MVAYFVELPNGLETYPADRAAAERAFMACSALGGRITMGFIRKCDRHVLAEACTSTGSRAIGYPPAGVTLGDFNAAVIGARSA